MNANSKLPLVYLLFLYTFISNKPLCEVTPTVPRGILPSPYVHIVTHKQSEKYQVWSDKTPGGAFPVTPYITFISYRHPHPPLQISWAFQQLHFSWNDWLCCLMEYQQYIIHIYSLLAGTFWKISRDFSPESAASPASHSEHLSPASQWWEVTETVAKHNLSLSPPKKDTSPLHQK